MSLSFVDCELPKDKEESINSEGQREWGCKHVTFIVLIFPSHVGLVVHSWTWQYTRLLHNVMTTAFGAKTPHYSTVVELDRKIRDFPMPWRMRSKCGQNEDRDPSSSLRMQRWVVMAYKEASQYCVQLPWSIGRSSRLLFFIYLFSFAQPSPALFCPGPE